MTDSPGRAGASGFRQSLLRKYFLALFAAAVMPLLGSGGMEAWFGYQDQRERLDELLGVEARAAASRIQSFVDGIGDQLGWMVQLPWSAGAEERQRLDALRLLRQVPAIVSLTLVDGAGREQLRISRIGLNQVGSLVDRSADPAVAGARMVRIWYGPVTYFRDSEPFMRIAVAGNRAVVGVAVAEINLKLIWDVISAIHVGRTGHAFVLDAEGRLIAHPDISLVLRGGDAAAARPLRMLRDAIRAEGRSAIGRDTAGASVVAAMAVVPGVDWTVIVHQPLLEAFGPIDKALRRTGALLLLGSAFAGILAFWLARRMTGPIRQIEYGTEQIGAGHFDHRIPVSSADELGRLAQRFNAMAGELALSQERQERISRLRRFLAPQVAELVDRTGDDSLLEGRRVEVAVIFCDLRGFTPFSAKAAPDEVMHVLAAYFEALGRVITEHGATLTQFTGDGLMVLLNAPVICPEASPTAMRLAIDMQDAVQSLVAEWRHRGYAIGFGVGATMGPATVGQIGYENRLDYTAIGPVVNLAGRLCAAAEDGQILIDSALADQVQGLFDAAPLGPRVLKGFDAGIEIYSIVRPVPNAAA
ncbi:class 3 adenylate cyclase [Methylobacterium sp. BE186]|uniref:HAMP domain-containing protein n=1 Tax=Methylobacterium sp. BE186 TaxID=2817715 RepID=UPI0028624460|nr:adenylate/guanylate cyclase domain-containing protein [Methylobacterium sp. BE186]MDR7036710.1 class 3 adenylate cyclase [Methylobacterium sp. BE186]